MPRALLITADDFGIGPETSRGILDLAERGAVTSTVLLVNSPYAEDGVRQWNRRGRPVELGWHPCLTLDAPIAQAADVRTLVDDEGRFPKLGTLLKRLLLRRIDPQHVEIEFRAQHRRFLELTGFEPVNVNGHHHVHIFEPIAKVLGSILKKQSTVPYVRQVREPLRTLLSVKGARIKRFLLSQLGRRSNSELPGNDTLLGVTDPPFVHDPEFFRRWLRAARGKYVELTCHPGHLDATVAGRDGTFADGQLHRRAAELERLSDRGFLDCIKDCGFELVNAQQRQAA